jgi:hypothetical protein
MAPAKTIPHKSGGHQRYADEKAKDPARFQSELEGSDDDANAGALQPVKEPQDGDFEGFGTEEDSDGESIDIQTEKKQEKPVLPKDAEEEELERIIFGDSEGFRQGLEDFSLDPAAHAYGDPSDDSGAEEAELDDVADQDLFFFDAGPVPAPAGSVAAKAAESEGEDDKPAWEDSDDERLVVSLASVPRLRKLRETADDDMVNGKEYARRLRKQYQRLYPTPGWAAQATGKANKKRRRDMDDDESGDESASDMDVDDEDLSTQPLARLLKDADILARTSRSVAKRRKVQAGTIDIQRLKDVAKAGPVSPARPLSMTLLLTLALVCHNLSLIPSRLPTAPLLRSQLDAIPSPRQPQPAEPESSPHVPAHQAYPPRHHGVPSLPLRLTHLPQRATPLLPCLEHCNRQSGEGVARIRTPARTADNGKLLSFTQRKIHGSAWLLEKGWRCHQHSRCKDTSVGDTGACRVKRRCCRLCVVGRWHWHEYCRQERRGHRMERRRRCHRTME